MKKKEKQAAQKLMVEQLARRLSAHPIIFGLYAFGDSHFRDPSPVFHKTILGNAIKEQKMAVAAPRGHAKSTVLSFLYTIFCIVFKKKRHIVILQNTLSKACGSLHAVKYEIVHNPLLAIFGITLEKDAKEETIFVHPSGFRTRVITKGYEQMGSIRGEKFIAWRPDLVIVDDLEDDKSVENPILRAEAERIFNDAVDPAVDYKGGGQIIFIGTVLHDDALITKMISPNQYRTYKKYRYQALQEDGTALWEERYSVKELKAIEAEDPIKFAKEYQNDPISGAMKRFHEEDFRYWSSVQGFAILYGVDNQVLAKYALKDCRAAIGCDLAWEERREADESVIFPALLTPDDEVLLDTYTNKRGMRPDELGALLFQMESKYRKMTGDSVHIGFEKAKLEKVTKWLLGKAMRKAKHYLILKDVKWDKDKITRIVTRLQPRYATHSIFHRQGMGEYEHQLLRIPSGSHDDLPDAAQIVVQLLKSPKGKKKVVHDDDDFEWHRKRLIAKKNKKTFFFGNKKNRDQFPLRCEDTLH